MNSRIDKNSVKELLSGGYFSYVAAILTVIVMPVHIKYLPPFMILWLLCWIVENIKRVPEIIIKTRLHEKILFTLFITYYLWQVVGLLYSADIKMGLLNLFGRLSLLSFPIVLIFPGEIIKRRIKRILRYFAVASALLMLFSFSMALYKSIGIQDGHWTFNPHPPEYFWLSYFFSSQLIPSLHTSYVSLYILLAAIISFESFFDKTIKTFTGISWLITGIFLVISIYFLSSRAVIISSLILIPIYFIFKLRNNGKKKLLWIGFIIILFALMVPLILKNQRVSILYNKFFGNQTEVTNRIEPRFIIWDAALKIVRQNIIVGVGIGDVRTELVEEYKKIGDEIMIKERYNVHNQFLEVLLENGLIGLVIFIAIFVCMICIAIIDKNLLYGCFIFIIAFSFMFETMLYRLAGVSFFSLFSFLLLYYKPQRQQE